MRRLKLMSWWISNACVSLSTLHGRVVGEQTHLRDEMEAVKQNYSQLIQQHSQLQQTCDELHRIHDSDQREASDMRLLQQQVLITHTHTQLSG